MVDVLDAFNKYGVFTDIRLNMCKLFMCSCKRHCNINETHWLKSHAHLKGAMENQAMESFVVVFLHISNTLTRCLWMLVVVHV